MNFLLLCSKLITTAELYSIGSSVAIIPVPGRYPTVAFDEIRVFPYFRFLHPSVEKNIANNVTACLIDRDEEANYHWSALAITI
jgi:hypothetical protein